MPGTRLTLIVLTILFALRVVGQAIQRWMPVELLPPFAAWQGSSLSYPALLSLQILVVASMIWVCWRSFRGTDEPNRRAGRVLAWCGGIYMTGSVLRILIGVAVPDAPPWFSAWIPGLFHVVLACFVLTLARFHLRRSTPIRADHAV